MHRAAGAPSFPWMRFWAPCRHSPPPNPSQAQPKPISRPHLSNHHTVAQPASQLTNQLTDRPADCLQVQQDLRGRVLELAAAAVRAAPAAPDAVVGGGVRRVVPGAAGAYTTTYQRVFSIYRFALTGLCTVDRFVYTRVWARTCLVHAR